MEKGLSPLFTMKVELSPCNEKIMSEHPKQLKLLSDGTAKYGNKIAGKIRKNIWNYMLQFGVPTEATEFDPEGYNMFNVNVPGTVDEDLIAPEEDGKIYSYHCGTIPFPKMIPDTEYKCELIDNEDHFAIKVDDKIIGSVEQAKDRDRLGILRRMLRQGFTMTAQIGYNLTKCNLYLILHEA